MWRGLVVLRHHHSRETTSPDLRSAKRQLFSEEVVQLSEPRCEARTPIRLHEFSCPSVYEVLKFFLQPNFFVFDVFFACVPVLKG